MRFRLFPAILYWSSESVRIKQEPAGSQEMPILIDENDEPPIVKKPTIKPTNYKQTKLKYEEDSDMGSINSQVTS